MKAVLEILFSSLLLATVVGCMTSTPKVSASRKPVAESMDLNDARVLYELGRFDAAEQKLEGILRMDPENPMAGHLLELVQQGRYRRQNGQEQPWGYYPTIPRQPIYR